MAKAYNLIIQYGYQGVTCLKLLSVVLMLISIGLVVGPIVGVVCAYRDDVTGLVLPPEIKGAMSGDKSFILNDNVENITRSDDSINSILNGFVAPTFVSASMDENTKTFSVEISASNTLKYDLTLNTFAAEIQTPDHQKLAVVAVNDPFVIHSGESKIIAIGGSWTQVGEDYVLSHLKASSISVGIANIVVDVNGVTISRDAPIEITLPISISNIDITR
jgi:hypothetical protein